MASHRALLLSLALTACASPQRPPERPSHPLTFPPDVPTLPEPDASVDVAPTVTATEQIQRGMAALPVVPGPEAAWFPARILAMVVDQAHLLPSTAPPSFHDDQVVWTLLAQPRAESDRLRAVCDAVVRAEPRVVCATEPTEWNGSLRTRALFGWRASHGRPDPTLAHPLRALSRLGAGVCLVSAQRTLRTLDLTVRVPDAEVLGRSLALMSAVPFLSDLIMVRSEPHGDGLEAVLSWPLDRADPARADLADDLWPPRCDNASALARDARAQTLPIARMFITGARAHGAVLTVNHRDWLATEGDTVAGATISAITDAAVTLRMPGRPRPISLRYAP